MADNRDRGHEPVEGREGGHILTVNVEDYFQTTPASGVVPVRYWSRFERRVERNTLATLDLLDSHGATATFFVSGWIADVAPDLLREIVRRGHRVAAKGYRHVFPRTLAIEDFTADAVRAREAIERAAGTRVHGYRAARGGLSLGDEAIFEALASAGYAYDSSVRPFGFGNADGNRILPVGASGALREVPITSGRFLGLSLPVGGGNYLRQLPRRLTRAGIARAARDRDAQLVFYFHVWELDPDMPRLNGVPRMERIRLYRNLDRMAARIEATLDAYRFTSAEHVLGLAAEPVAHEAPRATPAVLPQAADASAVPVTLVVPCFNEATSLPFLARTLALLAEHLRPGYRLSYVFVDDGSSDETWAVLETLFGGNPDAILHKMPRNSGVAAAIMAGIGRATTETVASIDCDCSYDPFQLARLLDAFAPGVSMVTASPYHREGRVLNVPAWRLGLSRGLSLIYSMLLRQTLATYTSCLRVYRRSAVHGIELSHPGYLGIAELLIELDRRGDRIVEVPATLEARLFGQSKMKTIRTIRDHLGLIRRLVRLKFQSPDTALVAPPQSLEKDRG